MALSTQEHLWIRRQIARKAEAAGAPIRWTKAAIGAAADAVEDLLSGSAKIQPTEIDVTGTALPVLLSARIDDATSGFGLSLTATEKRFLIAFVLERKFRRDG